MILSVSPPRIAVSSSLTILTTCWLGSSAWLSRRADGLLADAGDDVADDADVDVGLEQRGADLAQDLVDVGLGQPALAADLLDDAFEADGQRVEHATRRLPAEPGGPQPSTSAGGRQPCETTSVTTSSTVATLKRPSL